MEPEAGITESEVDADDESADAVKVTEVVDVTAVVGTLKIHPTDPAGTVTVAAGLTTAVLDDVNDTVTPPDGAAEVSDTVPVVAVPPQTVADSTVKLDTVGLDCANAVAGWQTMNAIQLATNAK